MGSEGTLAPRLRQRVMEAVRGPGWRRMALARRVAAGLLAALALVLAVAPGDAGVPVLVAAHDLAPGSRLVASDVVVRRWPADLAPAGAVADPQFVEGRVLAGAARSGEVVTDVRLVGPELAARLHSAPDSAAVPVRLADAQVAGLLVPGSRVDVVAPSARGEPVVLAEAAAVLAVLPASEGPGSRGQLVLVAMSQTLATRVAAAALTEQVAITLR
ncbi:MAG: SAF domain-containing protein [Pseudonocardia sp.]